MDELGFEAGQIEGRHWMTEILKAHNRFTAFELYQERVKERAGIRGLSAFDHGFCAGADEVLRSHD